MFSEMKPNKMVTAPKSSTDNGVCRGEVKSPSNQEGVSSASSTDTTGTNRSAVEEAKVQHMFSMAHILLEVAEIKKTSKACLKESERMFGTIEHMNLDAASKLLDVTSKLQSFADESSKMIEESQNLVQMMIDASEETKTVDGEVSVEATATSSVDSDKLEPTTEHTVLDVDSGTKIVTDNPVQVVDSENSMESLLGELEEMSEPIPFKEGAEIKTPAIRRTQRVSVSRPSGFVDAGDVVLTVPTTTTDSDVRRMAMDIEMAKQWRDVRGCTIQGPDQGAEYWGQNYLSPKHKYNLFLVCKKSGDVSRINDKPVRVSSLSCIRSLSKKCGYKPSTIEKYIQLGVISSDNVVDRSKYCNKRRLYDTAVDELIAHGVKPHIANRNKLRRYLEHRNA